MSGVIVANSDFNAIHLSQLGRLDKKVVVCYSVGVFSEKEQYAQGIQ